MTNDKTLNFEVYQSIENLSSYLGGPSRSVSQLSSQLMASGLKVNSITKEGFEKSPNLKSKIINYGNKHKKYFFLRPFINYEILSFARKNFKSKSLKIFHDHGVWLPFNNTISQICKELKIPLIISPRGMLEPWSINYKFTKKKLAWYLYQNKALKNASVLHATSLQEAKNLKKLNIGLPIAVIPNGIYLPQNIKKKTNCKLSEIGIVDDGRKILLYLGRIHPKKGLINLLEAWKDCPYLFKEWRLIIAGYPELNYSNILHKFIDDNNLRSSVTICRPFEGKELENIYKNAKIFILPTFSENFGIVVAEALSYGLPTITTNGTPWEILNDEKAGWCCETNMGDIKKTLFKMSKLTDDEYNLMSKNALRVAREFDWKRITESYIKLYKWVLGLSNKPDFIL